MINLITSLLPWATLASHFFFVFLILAYIFRQTWGRRIVEVIKDDGIFFGTAFTLFIFLASIFYSSVVGYPPCELCWWQRIFLFPQLILFIVAWKTQDRGVFKYVLWFSIIAGLLSAYQIYTQAGGFSLLDCTAVGGECSKVYVKEFGYITIPVMGITSVAYLIFLAIVNRKYD